MGKIVWHPDAILVPHTLEHLLVPLRLGNQPLGFLEYFLSPPVKCRLIGDPVGNCILCNFNRVVLLEGGERQP